VLRFVGDGEDRESLRREAADLGLADRTEFPGPRPDIEREYADAQLFALASRWEGFPNAVAEALAHGLPVVGFAGCAGLNDLVAPERNGVLAPGNGDAEALAAALDRLMGDAELRARLGQEGISIIQTYRPERVLALWEDVLTEAAHRRGRG
jgi:glycosyltransferase involved in cell wall biosynthesis